MKDFVIKVVIIGGIAFFAWKGYQAYVKADAATEQNRRQSSTTDDLIDR